ncbi:T9SS type A sorting domain-containing protein [Rubrivirga sp.]|uniref:T9SS type A sorting domain-containing protein n=1 Tax=Rubrivirga sp. TaxID=1885344 RepID=UPI003C76E660
MRYVILAAALCALPASAQLSFTADDYRPSGFSEYGFAEADGPLLLYSTDASGTSASDSAIDALIARTGADQTWDFTVLETTAVPITPDRRVLEDPAGLPGADLFTTATAAYEDGRPGVDYVSYTYARVDGDSLITLGSVTLDSTSTVVLQSRYTPDGRVQATFPFTFGTSFEDEGDVDASPRPLVDLSWSETVEVVGYGTLVVPSGSYECLMVRRTETSDGFTTSGYTWVTADRAGAVAVNNELGPGRTFREARFYEPRIVTALEDGSRLASLSVAPNPTASTSTVRLSVLEAGPARVAVYDALGREVAALHDGVLGAGDHGFSTSRLTPGLYVVRIEVQGHAETARFVVAR